jgi:hypothetical protein
MKRRMRSGVLFSWRRFVANERECADVEDGTE